MLRQIHLECFDLWDVSVSCYIGSQRVLWLFLILKKNHFNLISGRKLLTDGNYLRNRLLL